MEILRPNFKKGNLVTSFKSKAHIRNSMFELDYVTNLIKETFFFLLRKPEVLSGNQF